MFADVSWVGFHPLLGLLAGMRVTTTKKKVFKHSQPGGASEPGKSFGKKMKRRRKGKSSRSSSSETTAGNAKCYVEQCSRPRKMNGCQIGERQ
jgi:hypothetical protein